MIFSINIYGVWIGKKFKVLLFKLAKIKIVILYLCKGVWVSEVRFFGLFMIKVHFLCSRQLLKVKVPLPMIPTIFYFSWSHFSKLRQTFKIKVTIFEDWNWSLFDDRDSIFNFLRAFRSRRLFKIWLAFSKDQGVTFQYHDVGVFKITVTLLR